MADGARIQEVIARVEAAGAEPSAEAAGEASQTDGAASAEGSASADAGTLAAPDGAPTDPAASAPAEATTTAPDADVLRAKLQRDREKRAIADERRRLKAERDQVERDKQEAQAVRDKWAKLGKEGSIIDRVKEAGGDPREVFEAMKREALEAGTPEAQIAKVTSTFEAKIAALEAKLAESEKARETEKQQIAAAQAAQVFETDFQRAYSDKAFASIAAEYPDPADVFPIVAAMKENPDALFQTAEALGVDLGVDLTDPDATFNMSHIFRVLVAQQAAHEAKKQRLTKSAEPPQSPPVPPAEAKKPTVNGAEARKAGTTIGNDLAASSGGAPPDTSHEDHKARLKRLIEKYG
jgi:hypothetical protein